MPGDGHAVLDAMLGGPLRDQAIQDVCIYFAGHTGRIFERLDGGGDAPATADIATSADVVAVSMLSIRWRATASLELLGARCDALSAELARVPHRPIDENLALRMHGRRLGFDAEATS